MLVTLPVEQSCDSKQWDASQVPPGEYYKVLVPVDVCNALRHPYCDNSRDLQTESYFKQQCRTGVWQDACGLLV